MPGTACRGALGADASQEQIKFSANSLQGTRQTPECVIWGIKLGSSPSTTFLLGSTTGGLPPGGWPLHALQCGHLQ